ncbi:hypothetical protein UFOVP1296_88 [uncultured Caudovirales phage]|uniref:Uncharacterized protein n=1 Tax=uncultured Caudovirales phage TaxID=2100421 RepID=A0A6J5MB20_9CAUD|nr:hypothetical protein UFOVP471_5 [uncultured Caudovirales phage]CAB4169689.1 hypothetical protein UFOVP890_88 [uncultured Caudovirales phage]CAB4196393.1 hypothetical protein UFOVP1296_88 [uncultured Caudovirales phage]
MISDNELIVAVHPLTKAPVALSVVYKNAKHLVFKGPSVSVCRKMAHEYGVRFLGGQKVSLVEILDAEGYLE